MARAGERLARSRSRPTWRAAARTSAWAGPTRPSTRRSPRSAASTSSARTGTKARGSTCSCAAAPAGRAIPGESRFFVSLEDELLVRFGLDAPDSGAVASRHSPTRRSTIRVVTREVARAQRIVEGQNFEIRRTLARYAAVVEQQHRQSWSSGGRRFCAGRAPDVWEHEPERRAALVAGAGEEAVGRCRARVTLGCIDRAWRDHLALCCRPAGGHPPRAPGRPGSADALHERSDQGVPADRGGDRRGVRWRRSTSVRVDGATLDLAATGLKGPRRRGPTWSTTTRSRIASARC